MTGWSGRPSWAGGVDGSPARPSAAGPAAPGDTRPPATLVAAAGGVLALTAAGVVHVLGRDDLEPALRVALAGVLAVQVALVVLALRRSPAAVMVLLLFVTTTLLASLAGGLGDARALLAVGAGVVLVLLARSLRWFPGYER